MSFLQMAVASGHFSTGQVSGTVQETVWEGELIAIGKFT